MIKYFSSIFASATFKQSSITFSATLINGVLGAIFYILAARFLGPADFGLLIVAILVFTFISDISDLGLNTGLVRFVGKYWLENKEKAFRFIKLAVKVKIITSSLIVFSGFFFAPLIAKYVFKKEILHFPLLIAFIGVMGMQFYSLSTSLFQSLQKFWIWGSLQVGTNLIRLILILALLFLGRLDLLTVLAVYITLPFVGFIIAAKFFPKDLMKVKNDFSVAREYFHYSKWVALSTLLAAISARLDTFMSARLLSPTELGFYGAANQLVAVIPQVVGALGTVFAPKMAGMGSKETLIKYFKKTQLLVFGLAVAAIIASPIVIFLIPILFGLEYAHAVPALFFILLLAMLVFLIAVPAHNVIFYYYGYSKLFTWLSLLHLFIVGLAGWYLIPLYGAMGAAVTVLVAMVINFLISLLWVLRRFRVDD